MDQEELALYEALETFAVDNLFWSLTFVNNAVFNTPLKEDTKNKLLSLSKNYTTILTSIYPMDKCNDLTTAMANNNQLFIAYIEHFLRGDSQANTYKQKWKDNGLQIAALLNKLNPYWKTMEWSAMIGHETDLLETIVSNLKSKNYMTFINTAPICRRLAVDMSKYMCTGITKQQQDNW